MGRRRESMVQLELRDEGSRGAIDQELSTDMTNAENNTDVLSNETMAGQKKARSVQLYFVSIMLCSGRALDRIANAPHCWGLEAWRLLFRRILRRTMQDLL